MLAEIKRFELEESAEFVADDNNGMQEPPYLYLQESRTNTALHNHTLHKVWVTVRSLYIPQKKYYYQRKKAPT
jgi:hypothetical protein